MPLSQRQQRTPTVDPSPMPQRSALGPAPPWPRPRRWCQHLAGLDFAPPLPLATQLQGSEQAEVMEKLDTYRRQQRVIHVIDRLRAIKTGDEALK